MEGDMYIIYQFLLSTIARINTIEKILIDNHITSELWMSNLYEQEKEKLTKKSEERSIQP